MVDSVEFSLTGLDSLLGKFDAVTDDVKRKGGRAALRKAAKMLTGIAKENAAGLNDPSTGRLIASNIDLRWDGKHFKSTGDLAFRVGVLQGARLPQKGAEPNTDAGAKTPHWRLLEFGTQNMPAQPFLRRALADNIGSITGQFLTEYEKALDRAIKRALKKASI
jgi:HK97 gp10 family phage protein